MVTEPVYYNDKVERESVPLLDYGTGRTIDDEIAFGSEPITVSLSLTNDEYVQIFSSLMNGAMLTYPENWANVIGAFWLKMVQGGSMTCQDMIDCINNDPDVQAAITQMLLDNGAIDPNSIDPDKAVMNNRTPPAVRGQPVKGDPENCDLDTLWAGIRNIVLRLDDGGRTFLEQVVVQADKQERINALIEAVPVIGDMVAAIHKQFVELAPDLLNLYNAYSSLEHQEEIACGLFEQVCSLCRYPNYDDVYDYYATLGISGIQDIASLTLTAITDYIFQTNNLAAAVTYHSIIAFQLFILYLDATFLSSKGRDALTTWALLGEDDPSDDWILLCDACVPEGCVEYDFTLSSQGFTVWTTGNRPFGVYVQGVGWQCTWDNVSGAGFDNRVYLERINFANGNLDVTRVEAVVVPTAGGSNRNIGLSVMNNTTSVQGGTATPATVVNSTPQTVGDDFSATGNGIRLNAVTTTTTPDQDAVTIQKIRIFYSLGTPTGGLPC